MKQLEINFGFRPIENALFVVFVWFFIKPIKLSTVCFAEISIMLLSKGTDISH